MVLTLTLQCGTVVYKNVEYAIGSVSTVIIGAPPPKPTSSGTVISMGSQQHLIPAQVYATAVSPNTSQGGPHQQNTMTLNGSDGAKSVILSNSVPGK